MASHYVQLALLLLTTPMLVSGENLQSWSHLTYKDEPYTLSCDSHVHTLMPTDQITWTHGEETVVNGTHYDLYTKDGVEAALLHVRMVNDETRGIYICHIHNDTGVLLDRVVLGLNIGVHKYHDDTDKYEENIIIGLIAGASVFVFIICVCLINHFRYLSDESKEKRRVRKEERLRKMGNKHGGMSNASYENGTNGMAEPVGIDSSPVDY